MDTTDYHAKSQYLSDQRSQLWKQAYAMQEEFYELEYNDPRRLIIESDVVEVRATAAILSDQISTNFAEWTQSIEAKTLRLGHYVRPSGIVTKWFTRLLAPLPDGMETINPTDEALEKVPSYRWLPILTIAGVVTFILTMLTFVPWLGTSPFSLIFSAASINASSQVSSLSIFFTVVAIVIVFLALIKPHVVKKVIDEVACSEEQWFRSGAENWTTMQRIRSCAAFGFCHVINIVYPLVTLIALTITGGIFMAVYLHEYRRSGDVGLATLASTKFHAAYNRYAFGLLIGSCAFYGITSLL